MELRALSLFRVPRRPVLRLGLRAIAALGAACLLTACAGGPRPGPGGAPAKNAAPAGRPGPPPEACANSQYGFRCELPAGYVLTQEGRGPGTVMKLAKRARASGEESNLTVRVAPLGKSATLESFVERRVARDLKRAVGVAKWEKHAAFLAGHYGVELTVEREYASGPYRSRIYCFNEGADIFIVDHTAPAERFEREKAALDAFLDSIQFTGRR